MAASSGIKGFGTAVAVNTGTSSSSTNTAISQCHNFSLTGLVRTDIDISNFDSPDSAKEYIRGMIEPGELQFDAVYAEANVTTLTALLTNTSELLYWKVTFTDGSWWGSCGYLKSISQEGGADDKITMRITAKLSGLPAFTKTG